MPSKTRSTSTTEGKQTDTVTMAALDDDAIAEMLASAKESKDPNRLLLLNILANQKLSDEKHEVRFSSIDASILASKTTLEKHIDENNKELTAVKGDIT